MAVVVPTVDEEAHLPGLLEDLADLRVPHEVVVVDGGSRDATIRVALRLGARVLDAPRGRAEQMSAGAHASAAPWLLFVHADSRLPGPTLRRVEEWLESAGPRDAAHLTFALDGPDRFWRFIEFGQALRERLTGLVYGDQGLLLSRALYDEVGGFPPLPVMEDVAMVSRVRRRGRLRRLDATLLTSPRRYRHEGRWRTWLRNTLLIGLFRLGVPARALARWYPPAPRETSSPPGGAGSAVPGAGRHSGADEDLGPAPDTSDVLLVFAKAPRPGSVKTRLAADLGDRAATDLYRRMGWSVVQNVREGPWRTVVAFTPADARPEVTAWLGGSGLAFRPQVGADLGGRMEEAFLWAFRAAGRVCVVGTDTPDLSRALVRRAFRHLDDHDVVIGPARDGGYWLLGTRRFVPELFRGVPWSTGRVLEVTLRRAMEAGLSVARLPVLVDVDTLRDLSAEAV